MSAAKSGNRHGFMTSVEGLLYNKEFMKEAVEANGQLFYDTPKEFKWGFDILLAAMNSSQRPNFLLRSAFNGNLIRFGQRVREKIDISEKYTAFLEATKGRLDLGPETTVELEKMISTYLGVPNEVELQKLYVALIELEKIGH